MLEPDGTEWSDADPDGEIFPTRSKSGLRPFIRTRFNYDTNLASLESSLSNFEQTRTQQQFADEVDINTIVRRFGLTGELPQGLKVPMQGDFSQVIDYQSALHLLMAADEAFLQMPSDVRKRFDNDPGKFVEFVSDPSNKDQVKQWGLGAPETALAGPIEVRVIPDPSDPPKTS